MLSGQNPEQDGQQKKQAPEKKFRGQVQRKLTSSSTPGYASQDNSSQASPVTNIPKKLNFEEVTKTPVQNRQNNQSSSLPAFHFLSSSSSSSSSESEELEAGNQDANHQAVKPDIVVNPESMKYVNSAIAVLEGFIPAVNPEFDRRSTECSSLRINIGDGKTRLYPIQLTEDEKTFLNSGVSQFKFKIEAFNEAVKVQIDILEKEKASMNAAKKTFNDFLAQYQKHWEQNEKNRIELIEIKKAIANAYYQAAEQYLQEEVYPKRKDDAAHMASPTRAVSSPDSSPKKKSAFSVVAQSFVQSVGKTIGNEEALKASYAEKFNPLGAHPAEENFPSDMALGFSGRVLDIMVKAFENRVSNCTLIAIQNRMTYLLSHFEGSRVHTILIDKFNAEKKLADYFRVEYDENKKSGVFVWHDDCLRKDRELIDDDKKINRIDQQSAHIDEIRKQFQAQYPNEHALLESMKQANVALERETISAPLKKEEVAENPVLSRVNEARIAVGKLKEKQAVLKKDLDAKKILYKRYQNIPTYIEELKEKETELKELEEALTSTKLEHEKKMQDWAAEIESISAVLEQEKKEANVVEEKAQKASMSNGLPAQANRTTNHSAGESSGSSEAPSHSNLGLAGEAAVLPVLAVAQKPVVKSKSERACEMRAQIEQDYQEIQKVMLKKSDTCFDEQEARIKLLLTDYETQLEKTNLDINDQKKEQDSRQEKERQTEAQLTGKKDDLLEHLQGKLTQLKAVPLEGDASADEKVLHGEIQTYQLPANLSGQAWAVARKTLKGFQFRRTAIDVAKRNAKQAPDPVVCVVSNGSSKPLEVSETSLPPLAQPKQVKQPKARQPKKAEPSKKNSAKVLFHQASGEPSNLILFSFWIIGVWVWSVIQILFQRQDNRSQFGLSPADTTPAAVMAEGADQGSPTASRHGSRKGKSHRLKQSAGEQNGVSGDSHAKMNQQLQGSLLDEASLQVAQLNASASQSKLDPNDKPSQLKVASAPSAVEATTPAPVQGLAVSKRSDWAATKDASLGNINNSLFTRFCMLLFNFAGDERVGFGIKAEGLPAQNPSVVSISTIAHPLKPYSR